MDWLTQIYETSDIPVISAFLLGLMTAISPCPMATNITATAYIAKQIDEKKKVFLSGLVYTLGRAFAYSLIGLILALGASKFHISSFMQSNGEKILAPLLIIIGLFMLDVIKMPSFGGGGLSEKLRQKLEGHGMISTFLMGIIFALAFCPYSGILYFGMLIPLTLEAGTEGFILPFIYAIGTGLPVIMVSFIIAFGIGSIGTVYNKMQTFEKWFRKIIGTLFVIVGIYYALIFLELISF